MNRVVTIWTCLLFAALVVDSSAADELVLKSGGRIRGTLLPARRADASHVAIRTDSGATLRIPRSHVKETIRASDAQRRYEQVAPQCPDTVAAQWKLADWCHKQGLHTERRVHLRRIIRLDPDHVQARRALGYRRVDGRWHNDESFAEENGLVYYRGRWRAPQVVAVLKKSAQREAAEKQWAKRLRAWRDAMTRDAEAFAEHRDKFLALKDVHAVPALAKLLYRDPYRQARLLYVSALGKMQVGGAHEALINTSLMCPDIEVREAALRHIVRQKPSGAVAAYIHALGSNNIYYSQRAADALRRIGSREALAPLIESLVVEHVVRVTPPGGGSADAVSTTFATDGQGNPAPGPQLQAGDQSKVIRRRLLNHQALAALVELSGESGFGFNQKAWRAWLAAYRAAGTPDLNARRDDP